jgi:histidinol phosphatase-like PHP family hydrolase
MLPFAGMAPVRDLNMDIAGLLRDMAFVHASPHGRMAYKRAAQAVLALPVPLDEFVTGGRVRDVAYLGPATERVILEYLRDGRSAIVEQAVAASGKEAEVRAAHRFRANFLSRAGAESVLNAKLPGVVSRDDYLGDLQMHTEWSDGGETIAAMAEAARERGYRYIGVSDHSYGLKIARGMSMEAAAKQRAEIERLNAKWKGAFRVIQGIESNILPDGGPDMTPGELRTFELILAAPHSKLRIDKDQTDRMLATVRHPQVHVLAHPRGRMYSRQGVLARWDEVFEEAAKQGVAIELDGDPYRQDLDHTLAKRALAAGCLFAIDSDAHSGVELAYAEIGLAHARHARIPPDRVINTWPAERLLEWAQRKRRGETRRPARRAPAARAGTRAASRGTAAKHRGRGSGARRL